MKKIILSIDDNKDVLMLEKIVLTQAGYEVHTAENGQDALDKIKVLEKIDLILLDYEMDQMNGPEFLECFEAQAPARFEKIPVIYVTAYDKPPQKLTKSWIPKLRDIDQFVKDVRRFVLD